MSVLPRVALMAGLLVPCLAQTADDSQADDPPERPQDIGLVERTGTRLVQFDVSVTGPPDVVTSLEAADFRLRVHLSAVDAFELDRLCPEAAQGADAVTAPASYLFYHDQTHLTLPGRQNALSLTRQLIPQLIRDGNQGMLVSSSRRLEVVQPMTDDADLLLRAVDQLQKNREQWDTFANQEDARLAEVVRSLNNFGTDFGSVDRAIGIARRYQMEETWRAEKSMRRLSMTLTRLADVQPPKAVLYFSDTLRSSAGGHYMALFGQRLQQTRPGLLNMNTDSLMVTAVFDRIVNEAAAYGVRFYPVWSLGLTNMLDTGMASGAALSRTQASPGASRSRQAEARDSLASLAKETGGYAFTQGQSAEKITQRLDEDFSCIYVLSFDPAPFNEDKPLRVSVETSRPGVKLSARGRLVIQGESARRTSRLLSTFASNETGAVGDFEVHVSLVPTGFEDGQYDALLQISVPPLPLNPATWDLGASVIRGDKVARETSGRLTVSHPGVPVIYETELRFRPGEYQIVAVGHESNTGLMTSKTMHVSWPELKEVGAGPIAVLQPVDGAFLRSSDTRKLGSLARSDTEPVQTDRPTAVVGLVCRARRSKGQLAVERTLIGASEVEFPPLELDLDDEPCAQIRDLIPAGSLGEGYYRYHISVRDGNEQVYQGEREFLAVAPRGGPR